MTEHEITTRLNQHLNNISVQNKAHAHYEKILSISIDTHTSNLNQLITTIEELSNFNAETITMILSIKNAEAKKICFAKYIEGKTINQLIIEYHRSRAQIYNLLNIAIKDLKNYRKVKKGSLKHE